MYWLILGASQVYHYYKHYLSSELQMERLERNFSEARLNALRMQLDPHFLFNALNTISSQVERDPRLARAMIDTSAICFGSRSNRKTGRRFRWRRRWRFWITTSPSRKFGLEAN